MSAFKRMYVDIPTETHEGLKSLAETRGMSQKALLASLIDDAVKENESSKTTTTAKRKRK